MSAMLKVVEKEGMENKNKALDAALAQIERAFGKGSIMKLGQREAVEIESISTGSLGLDIALGPGYAKKLGVDIGNLLISQPDAGEQALEIADTLVRSGAVDVLVIDSVAALVPRAELEGEMGDSLPGLH